MKGFKVLIDTDIYTILIKIFGKKGLIDDSIKLFNEMKQNNIPTNTVTYNILINMYGNKGLVGDAIKLFNEMKQNNIPTDTYNKYVWKQRID